MGKSKIFIIRGQFRRDNVWVDQGFFGYIMTEGNNDNNFKGYCHQIFSEDRKEPRGVRFILGSFATNRGTGKKAASFLKLINTPEGWPTLYQLPDIESGEGSYYFYMGKGIGWTRNSEAKVRIAEIAYDKKIIDDIEWQFSRLDLNNPKNADMINQSYLCSLYAEYGI